MSLHLFQVPVNDVVHDRSLPPELWTPQKKPAPSQQPSGNRKSVEKKKYSYEEIMLLIDEKIQVEFYSCSILKCMGWDKIILSSPQMAMQVIPKFLFVTLFPQL